MLMVREIDTPTVIAVQSRYTALESYSRLRPHVLEVALPVLGERTGDGLRAILARRLEFFDIDAAVDDVVDPAAIPVLADFYAETNGSIRHVLAALDVAAATAVDNGDARLSVGHVRLGIEDWRDR
jgi:hypothetical protein